MQGCGQQQQRQQQQQQQQPGMLAHLSGIDFNQTLVSERMAVIDHCSCLSCWCNMCLEVAQLLKAKGASGLCVILVSHTQAVKWFPSPCPKPIERLGDAAARF